MCSPPTSRSSRARGLLQTPHFHDVAEFLSLNCRYVDRSKHWQGGQKEDRERRRQLVKTVSRGKNEKAIRWVGL